MKLRRRVTNLLCSCFDLLYLILVIQIFWLRNSYQQIDFEILIMLVYFLFGNFIKLAKKIQELRNNFNIFYQSYEI